MKTATVMNANYSLLIVFLALLYIPVYADSESPTKGRVRDLPEFRASLKVGILKEEPLDLNGDGKIDHIVYSNGGEETYLSILLANPEGFVVWHFPTAENYRISPEGNRFQVILEFDTFPLFGSLWGSDKHRWFDYYEITQDSVILTNHKHKTFFANQQKLYKARLIELKERQRQIQKTKNEDDFSPLEHRRINPLIERYSEWIRKADVIINAK